MIDILSYRQWAISQQFANTFGLIGLKLLVEGKSIEHLIKKFTDEQLVERYAGLPTAGESLVVSTSWDSESRLVVARTKSGQNVAIIPVIGALTKRGDLCSYGMRDYTTMLDRANKSQNIAAIVLDIESPGGTVDGTNEFGLAIKNSSKPVVAFGDGMVASAAYWVASQASEIIANKNNATEFGSIGVLCIYENYQAYIQNEIGSIEIIRAPQSVDKALVNPIEPLTEDLRAEIKEELKQVAKEFFSTVKSGRKGKLNTGEENIFTGKMYPASTALTLGMIDGLDTLQGAINRAGKLATQSSTSRSSEGKVNTMFKFKSNLFSSLFGKSENAEAPAGELSANAEAADSKVVDMEALIQSLQAAATTDATVISAHVATIADLNAQIATLKNEKAELQTKLDAKPTGTLTTVIPGNQESGQAADHSESVTNKKSFRTPHDVEADAIVAANFPHEKKK